MSETGSRLNDALAGRYAIERELGEGGMASVYLADDLRHERKVAIKVLKPELAAVIGADRFLGEIRTTANLQHPHIVPLFDSGEADGFLFYVMPFVEGESLRERLDREGPLPIAEAVRLARGVAAALDHAHARGVVHRDIKPANILLQDGEAQVSDFGIALAVSAAGGGRLTETGMSLGTPLYMSPEQAAGDQDVTGRSDIYSLGCVLYEMLAGDPPHTGPTARVILTRALTEEPRPITEMRRATPPHVAAATARALEKLPADRFADGGAFAAALADPSFRWPEGVTPADARALRRRFLAASGIAAVLAILAAWGWTRSPPAPATAGVSRLAIPLPDDRPLWVSGARAFPFDLSRDGRRIVYVGYQGGNTRLFLRELASDIVRPMPGTEGAGHPFFSPEGDEVGFFSEGRLKRAPVGGGAPIEIVEVAGRPFGASWGPDGTILYTISGSGLFRISASTGEAVEITLDPVNAPPADERDSAAEIVAAANPRWPEFLPGGDHALVTIDGGSGVVELATGRFRYLVAGSQAGYLPTGHLMYNAGEERLRIIPFDAQRLEVAGAAAPALENVFRGPGSGAIHVRVSDNGTLVYVAGGFERSLARVDRDGRETAIEVEPRGYRFPAVSPSGAYVAVVVDPRPSDIWIVDLRRLSAQRLTTGAHSITPGWAPDGDRLAFAFGEDQHWVPWPGGGEPRRVSDRPLAQWTPAWLPDGRIIAHESHPETGDDLVSLVLADGTSEAFLVTPANEREPEASPDGEWIAFVSDASGADEVYVVPSGAHSASSRPVQVSIGGGRDPRWSADGSEIFYRNGNAILAVPVRTEPTFEPAGDPQELFSGSYDFTQTRNWDVAPDGTFLMIRADPRTTSQFQVIVNWFEELRGGAGPEGRVHGVPRIDRGFSGGP